MSGSSKRKSDDISPPVADAPPPPPPPPPPPAAAAAPAAAAPPPPPPPPAAPPASGDSSNVSTTTTAAAAATAATAAASSTKRITQAAIDELFRFFDDENFARNQNLPKGTSNERLNAIYVRHSLKPSQAARQLVNWKAKKFGLSEKTFSHRPETVRKSVEEFTSGDSESFAEFVIDSMLPQKTSSPEAFKTNYSMSTKRRENLLQSLLLGSNAFLLAMVVETVDAYTEKIVEVMPKVSKMVPDADLKFSLWRKRNAFEKAQAFALAAKNNFCTYQSESMEELRLLFLSIEDVMGREWGERAYEVSTPEIVIPPIGENKVHPYSEGVLYYTAGWTLHGLGNVTKKQYPTLFNWASKFSEYNSVTKEEAAKLGLPTYVVDRKEAKRLTRPNKAFFDYICHIETIYLTNVTTSMMLAYIAGDLFKKISSKIMADERQQHMFCALLPPEMREEMSDEDVAKVALLMNKYILTKFKRMRGRWFAKALEGQSTKGSTAVDTMATRPNVATKAAIACAKGQSQRAEASKAANQTNLSETSANDTQDLQEYYSEALSNVMRNNFDDQHDEAEGDLVAEADDEILEGVVDRDVLEAERE